MRQRTQQPCCNTPLQKRRFGTNEKFVAKIIWIFQIEICNEIMTGHHPFINISRIHIMFQIFARIIYRHLIFIVPISYFKNTGMNLLINSKVLIHIKQITASEKIDCIRSIFLLFNTFLIIKQLIYCHIQSFRNMK